MKKIINFDKMFEKVMHSFIEQNAGKYTERELENKIAALYQKFGDKKFDELGGLSSNEYYCAFSSFEKVAALEKSITEGIPVSDFLCEAITADKECENELMRLIDSNNEEVMIYAINLLGDMSSKLPLKKYLILATERSVCDDVLEIIKERLVDNADDVSMAILAAFQKFNDYQKAYFAEILASSSIKDDRILAILTDQFLLHPDNIPEFAALIAKYGDDRALDTLYSEIERDDINYQDFQEIRFAIEALGGEYTKERDFTNDTVFKKVMKQAEKDREKTAPAFGGKIKMPVS